MNLFLITLVDMGFSGMFSDPHSRYTQHTCGSVFITLVDVGFNVMFSDHHCRYKGLQVDLVII